MGLVRDRWKIYFRRSFSLPPPSPLPSPLASANSQDSPPEFLCPISGILMADPVILSSGETFERACIVACRDLSISPPSLSLDLSSSFPLIPNTALRSAILRWCDIAGIPRPIPMSSDFASRLALGLLPSSNSKPQRNSSSELHNENSPTTSSSSSSSLSSSSEIITPNTPKPEIPATLLPADPLEDKILNKLKQAQFQEQVSALFLLLEATRESASRRVALGSPLILTALRNILLSRHAAAKSTAIAIIVNLSLEPANKIRIVRSGAVPSIIDALHSSLTAAREHAAGALFSLALEEQNRTAMGVLGAVPPLLRLFCSSEEALQARIEAGMALHYLTLAEMNVLKLVRIAGSVKGLLSVVKGEEMNLRRVAMRIMVRMVKSKEGRASMLDAGTVETAVAFLREKDTDEVDDEEKEMMVTMMYGMSIGGLRFRGIARRAGAEEALEKEVESLEGEKKEMVRMTLTTIKGEVEREKEVARFLWAAEEEEEEDDERNCSSETLVARRTKNRDLDGGSGPNSAGF